jgi:hypothetical protein
MKSVIKNINKTDAELLLRLLSSYSICYYRYKNGNPYQDGKITDAEADSLTALSNQLAEKIGLDLEAGY